MALTLVVNPGSSSKKYALYEELREVLRASFSTSHEGVRFVVTADDKVVREGTLVREDYAGALSTVLDVARELGLSGPTQPIAQVGVRVVAPGSFFQTHRLITAAFVEALNARSASAPLHIPPVLEELDVVGRLLPDAVRVGVSDSAFHATLPPAAYRYSIPAPDAEALDLKRYGYHGLSVASVARRVDAVAGRTLSRVVVCHLGSGSSVTALRDGVSVDTSMGFSPGDGLVMATRAGDLDTGALLELMRAKHMDPLAAYAYVQKQGGLEALTGSSDLRYILEQADHGDAVAQRALDRVAHCVKRQIGAMIAILGGVDGIVVTGTAGERSPALRLQCLGGLGDLGIVLSSEQNTAMVDGEGGVAEDGAPVAVLVMQTDEMGEVCRITRDLAASAPTAPTFF